MSGAIHGMNNWIKTADQQFADFFKGDFSGATESAQQMKATENAQGMPTAPIVNAGTNNTTSTANNLGRAALIATGSQGVQGSSPTGRMTLLGN